MTENNPFRVSISLTDFSPLFFDLGYILKKLKATGVDGVELVVGLKSRWNAKNLLELSKKCDVPIVSLHQPMWSGGGLWLDEEFINLAHIFNIKNITCHPLPGISFDHPRMQMYFQRLARLQKEKQVQILVENMEKGFLGTDADTYDMEKLLELAQAFDFKITLDTDHLALAEPHKEEWFPKIFPYLGNIHLSSFSKTQKHMPLYLGDFKTKEFLQTLYGADYQGLITLELQYPHLITFFKYDFEMIQKSVEIVKASK